MSAKERAPAADVLICNEGSVMTFDAVSDAGRQWVEANVPLESWQRLGSGKFAVDMQFARDLYEGMVGAGLVVRDA